MLSLRWLTKRPVKRLLSSFIVDNMSEASKKLKINNSRKWVKRFIYILVIVTLFAWSYSPIKKRMVQRRQIERLSNQLASEKIENKKLKMELELLRSDNEYIENIAREKLGMIKAGEDGYVVIEEDEEKGVEDEGEDASETESDGEGWWQRILSIFRRR